MVSRHVLQENPLYIIRKESKGTHSVAKRLFRRCCDLGPMDGTTNKSLCDVRLTREYNDVRPNMPVKGNSG